MSEDASLAVARHLETLLPPVDEIADALAIVAGESGPLGPEVTLPAVYVRIVTTALRAAALASESASLRAKIDAAGEKPAAPLDPDQLNALTSHLATEAERRSADPLEAAEALWRAAAVIAMVRIPAGNALAALDGIHALMRADVAQAIGLEATKQ